MGRHQRKTPRYLLRDLLDPALRRRHGHGKAVIAADPSKQNFCCFPHLEYVDEGCTCAKCGVKFVFSAAEKQHWYEVYQLSVNARPSLCHSCRQEHKQLIRLKQEHDALAHEIDGGLALDAGEKLRRYMELVDELCVSPLGTKGQTRMNRVRKRLAVLSAANSEKLPI
ncbi:MAG: hypothetical protein EA402_02090 [Planctomycetota bacterium]|nr:MAG: hypothetical protein EA402_02090 [Planctomycetota bacterium]